MPNIFDLVISDIRKKAKTLYKRKSGSFYIEIHLMDGTFYKTSRYLTSDSGLYYFYIENDSWVGVPPEQIHHVVITQTRELSGFQLNNKR